MAAFKYKGFSMPLMLGELHTTAERYGCAMATRTDCSRSSQCFVFIPAISEASLKRLSLLLLLLLKIMASGG